MASFDSNSLPTDPKARRQALFSFALARLDSIDDDATQINAIAIAGSGHAKENPSRGHGGDAVAKGLFDSIGRFSGDAAAIQELRATVIALRDSFTE
ncbi:hypothetical protein AWB71_01819 [Caballeronia peredens]|nr:hypothetical protein AWB71_01819 [Caballeronia peredens]